MMLHKGKKKQTLTSEKSPTQPLLTLEGILASFNNNNINSERI
jgi:hypothetical protein